MKMLYDAIAEFVSGDWGEGKPSINCPLPVYCVRAADVIPIETQNFSSIPKRFVSQSSFEQRQLRVGDIVIEKSGGSPTQSTGRAIYISQSLMESKKNLICSNFCCAIRVNEAWDSFFIYQYWRQIYGANIFFNYEGKTSGIKNLQLERALKAIPLPIIDRPAQLLIAGILQTLEVSHAA